MTPELGVIEGFYGKPWSWEEREETIRFLAPHGFGFYIYAPKADPYLRRKWQEDHPAGIAGHLRALSRACRNASVRFGAGISPFEAYDFNDAAQRALARKLSFLDEVGVDDLAILFDDMRGDVPDLAKLQVAMVHWALERTKATRVIMCPSYYSDDPILDRVFGARPQRYLEDLGANLDPKVEIFWTGEEVISRQFSDGHLRRVGEQLRRKPFLWDNYPVNDGHRMSQYLHLRGFTGRPAMLAEATSGHAINPSLQPTLFRIPALTLADSYRLGADYSYGESFRKAAVDVLGEELGARVREDLLTLQDVGLDRLGDKEKVLRERYSKVDHAGAREIIAWLDGG
ncbi:MAG TPA: beta-N-acetylglucosaminidase domain-containing protein, partial [Gemmatimonadaceae bacterium]|nr:beta-N-acetylglucosaminidase domain-containing protein [Gemmatimonadaceae bacterium]